MEYLLIFAAIPVYFVPTILTPVFNLSPSTAQNVFFINLVWGWTGIGWIVSLIFAFLGKYEYDASVRESKQKQLVETQSKYNLNKQKLKQLIPTSPQEEYDDLQ
jgi:positive regulator of sigma E activity